MRRRNTSPSLESDYPILAPIIEHARVLSRVVTPVPRKPEPDVETASALMQEYIENEEERSDIEMGSIIKSKLLSAALILCSLSTPVCILIGLLTYQKAILLTLLVIIVAAFITSIAFPEQCANAYARLQATRARSSWLPNISCVSLFSVTWTTIGFSRSIALFFPIALYRIAATARYFVGIRLKQEVNGSRSKALHDVMKDLPSWVRRYYVYDTLMLPSHAKSSSIWDITARRDYP